MLVARTFVETQQDAEMSRKVDITIPRFGVIVHVLLKLLRLIVFPRIVFVLNTFVDWIRC